MKVTTFISALLRLTTVLSLRGVGKSQHYDDIQSGLFTPPVKIGTRASAWPAHEVAALNAARIAGKTDDQIRKIVIDLLAARITGESIPNNGLATICTSDMLPTADIISDSKTHRVSSQAEVNATLDQLTPSSKRSPNLLLKKLGDKK